MIAEDLNGIETFEWKGTKMYVCPEMWESGAKCQYNTHNLANLRDHIDAGHSREVKPQPVPKAFGSSTVKPEPVAKEFAEVHFAQPIPE